MHISPVHASMLRPVNDAWMDSRVPAIARRLQERDARLEIRAFVGQKQDKVHQYEIFWNGHFVARFEPSEVDEIYTTIIKLDASVPGYESTVDKLEKAEEVRERDASRRYEEVYTEMATHYARLVSDIEDGVRHFHGQAGYGEGRKGNTIDLTATITGTGETG